MTVQQFKERFSRHPQSENETPDPGSPETLPVQGRKMPGADGPIPVPPGGISIDPSLFDMPDLRV